MDKTKTLIETSAIIPTLNRADVLKRTLASFALQSYQPKEIIIVDASSDFNSQDYTNIEGLQSKIIHVAARERGAAKQRNQAIELAKYEVIGFFDDDIIFENKCLEILWNTLHVHGKCGGINCVITNQSYHPLGKISKLFYRLMGGQTNKSLAGKCIGPVINFWPDKNSSPAVTKVDWLFSGCTLYKKTALPIPVFDSHFEGYSLMEDVALSLRVGKSWILLNNSEARIFHDSQPGNEKDDIAVMAEMDLVNRYYIMKHILARHKKSDYLKLFLQQLFGAVTSKNLLSSAYMKGKFSALKKLRSI